MAVINVPEANSPRRIIPHTQEAGDPYFIGDCYERSQVAQEWDLQDSTTLPYLTYVKSLANAWKTLRHLADFMEIGTTPLRWKDMKANPKEREERMQRTNVTFLEYFDQQPPKPLHLKSAKALKETLSNLSHTKAEQGPTRLFLVEDLSQQVIEMLGSRFDIDPLFFREHIDDYNWFNTRDPWASAPHLLTGMESRQWFRLRNVRLRYFKSKDSFQRARQESNMFNVLRRPDDDQNHWHYLDAPNSIVALTRTRTTVWIGKDDINGGGTVAVVLVDPTVEEGHPLWYGHDNWLPTPSFRSTIPVRPLLSSTLFETIKNATETFPWFSKLASDAQQVHRRLVKPTLFTICADWLLVCDYAKARLGQIEWELEKPNRFRSKGDVIDSSLHRLHVWRRVLPVYREMVTETIEQALPAAERLILVPAANGNTQDKSVEDIAADYQRVMKALNELLARVDRLTSVVTSEISIEDSRRGLQENSNLARLTWLATTFIPLSFVTGFFSMQSDIKTLKVTFGWYFLAALPLTAFILVLAGKLGKVQKPKTGKAAKSE